MADRRAVVSSGIAVGIAVAAYGVSFGALAVAAGFDVWQTCILSLVMFTGGSQFALIGVVASGGLAAGPAAIASATLLGVRNLIYGIRMRPVVEPSGLQRIAAPWLTIDESTAVALAQHRPELRKVGFWATGIAVFIGWNLTTLAGALLGNVLGDARMWGLDAAAAAAFLGLIWPRLVTRQAGAVAVGAASVALLVTPVSVPGVPVLVAGVVALIIGWWDVLGRRGSIA
ncbi:MAG TPA: AzlC family ABC transporter permease [Microbacteriaceae bacterium]|nr:AzlC family ABC transporter permease [Microbacteriaceae bacterium]